MRRYHSPQATQIFIPARIGGSRFPGKMLAPIGPGAGPMILHTCHAAHIANKGIGVNVVTDSAEIAEAVQSEWPQGVKVWRTPEGDQPWCGTQRIARCIVDNMLSGLTAGDTIVNLQGDEPFIEPEDISRVAALSRAYPDRFATAFCAPTDEEIEDENTPICRVYPEPLPPWGEAYAIERFQRDRFIDPCPVSQRVRDARWWKHVGIYAFQAQHIPALARMQETAHAKLNRLEQLAFPFECVACPVNPCKSINTPEDLT